MSGPYRIERLESLWYVIRREPDQSDAVVTWFNDEFNPVVVCDALNAAYAAALEQAAKVAEGFYKEHRPHTEKKRFDVYDIQNFTRAASKLIAEDIRALISPTTEP